MDINTIHEERKTEFFLHLMYDFLTYIRMRLLPSLCAVLYFWAGGSEVAATSGDSFACELFHFGSLLQGSTRCEVSESQGVWIEDTPIVQLVQLGHREVFAGQFNF